MWDNIELLFEKMVKKQLIRQESVDFLRLFFKKRQMIFDIKETDIEIIMDRFEQIDLAKYLVSDEWLTGDFYKNARYLLADSTLAGAITGCFDQKDITQIFIVYERLNSRVHQENLC